jgi:hypothetical protein
MCSWQDTVGAFGKAILLLHFVSSATRLNWIQRWIDCDSSSPLASEGILTPARLSKPRKLKDYSPLRPSGLTVVRKLLYGSDRKSMKEVIMTSLVTLTATTVLLSSLLLLRRIW